MDLTGEWSAAFVQAVLQSEVPTLNSVQPTVPFDEGKAILWAKEHRPIWYAHWFHFDYITGLCFHPFEQCEYHGRFLPLINSLIPRCCILIAAQREKLARVDMGFLNRLLYWRLHFPMVLVFFALTCKRICQDAIIEFTNSIVSRMCRMLGVTAGYIAMMCHCSSVKRKIGKVLHSIFRTKSAKKQGSFKVRREHRWSEKKAPTRATVAEYFYELSKEVLDLALQRQCFQS